MENIKIEDIVLSVSGKVLYGDIQNKFISSVATDSRTKMENGMFVAIKGENTDGHKYIEDAIKNGAIAVLVSDIPKQYIADIVYIKVEDTVKGLGQLAKWYRTRFSIPFVAITGSVGKTTTKDMIASVLETKYKVHKTQGNFNSEIGAPLTVLGINSSCQVAIIEMGMDHLGQISKISEIVKPDVAVITNIGVAHIEYLKTRENILKAKCEVFESMSKNGVAILNADDDMLVKINNDLKKIWYGKNKEANMRVENITIDYKQGEVKANLIENGNKHQMVIPGLSEHLVYAAMSAICVGQVYGLTIEEAIQGVKNYKHTKMRMDIYKLEDDILVVDDTYNANPDSMKSLIDTVKKADKTNKILILGDMFELGEKSCKLHKDVLEYAINSNITNIYVVGDNMKKALEMLNINDITYFDTKEKLLCKIGDIIVKDSIVGIKASRGMKFENITEKILEKYTLL